MNKDKFLRKLVPSIPVLARTPVATFLDIADYFIKKNHPDWSKLPPASLRMRIGVGNKILRNHQQFIDSGNGIIEELSGKGYLDPGSHVLELGCGCGRNAIAFSNYLIKGGTYKGQDVDLEMISWCQENLQKDDVTFHHVDIFSKVYNPDGKAVKDYRFPANNSSINLIVSISVFSHLLYSDSLHYFRESARVLTDGGHLHMTFFLLDFLKGRLGGRWSFSHKVDHCYVENLKYPEAAVAYELTALEEMLSSTGLTIAEIYNKESHQQTVIAKKI
jgi:SAM-dependent methyltransferase